MATYGVGPAVGFIPDRREARFIARGGNVSAGRCYPLALSSASQITADGVTLATTPGDPGAPYGNAVAAGIGSTDRRNGIFVIALEDGDDQTPVRCLLKGLVKAYVVDSTNNAIAIGDEFTGGTNGTKQMDASAVAFSGGGTLIRKCIARALEEAGGTVSDGTTIWVHFDGEAGLGFGNSAS